MDSQQSSTEMGIHGGKRAWVWDAAAAAVLITAGVALRLVFRDVPNFAPVAALALFAGYYFRNAGWALLVPLSVVTDRVDHPRRIRADFVAMHIVARRERRIQTHRFVRFIDGEAVKIQGDESLKRRRSSRPVFVRRLSW